MIVVVALIVTAAIAVPHVLPLERAKPMVGASVWLSALALRAVASIAAVAFVVLFLPATRVFGLLTRWCWHAVLPLIGTHLPLDGHEIGDVATLVPGLFLAVSTLSLVWAAARGAKALRGVLRRRALDGGPLGSLIVPDGHVLVAAAGLRRPQVVVSAGALCAFDDAELAASVAHERGHIARRHRHMLLFGQLCRGIGRLVPGGGYALIQLAFALERDADAYALARRHDPLALASAICKAATASVQPAGMLALHGDGNVAVRVRALMSDPTPLSRSAQRITATAAVGMATLTLALAAALPAIASAGVRSLAASQPVEHCPE